MKFAPLVSIIMNIHNSEKYLYESIKSVISQTYQNWELICYDNNSSDNSKNIIETFENKQIKYFKSNKFLKLGKARNKAIEKASGELIAFLDSDDLWLPKKLEKQIPCFKSDKVGIVACDTIFFDNEGRTQQNYKINKPKKGYIFKNLLKNYNLSLETIIIRKKYLEINNIKFNENFEMIEELDLILALSLKCRFEFVDQVLAKWRSHKDSWSWKKQCLFPVEKKILAAKLKKDIKNFDQKYKKEFYYFERGYHLEESVCLLKKNYKNKARENINRYKFDGFKWLLFYLCCFFNYSFYQFFQKIRGRLTP